MQDLPAAPSDLSLAVRGPLQERREGRGLAKNRQISVKRGYSSLPKAGIPPVLGSS